MSLCHCHSPLSARRRAAHHTHSWPPRTPVDELTAPTGCTCGLFCVLRAAPTSAVIFLAAPAPMEGSVVNYSHTERHPNPRGLPALASTVPQTQIIRVKIPKTKRPGDQLPVQTLDGNVLITVPPGTVGGDTIDVPYKPTPKAVVAAPRPAPVSPFLLLPAPLPHPPAPKKSANVQHDFLRYDLAFPDPGPLSTARPRRRGSCSRVVLAPPYASSLRTSRCHTHAVSACASSRRLDPPAAVPPSRAPRILLPDAKACSAFGSCTRAGG